MNTPIYDFLIKYNASGAVRCHMPGHKGRGCAEELVSLYGLDITEIDGADSLFEANGIIAQSEQNMSSLYGTAGTVYSAGGSTLCIQTMLAIMKREKRRIFAVRNVHRAFLNALALLDLDAEWLLPEYSGGILSGELDLQMVETALKNSRMPSCLYVTSPDYTGKTADIAALAALCRKYDARLLVDNAHGAHLAFFEDNRHPIALGADMCCDSAHKMLPALTGAAMLHTSRPEYAGILKQTMGLFASTSPSYLIMASLDLCSRYIHESIRSDIAENLGFIKRLKDYFSSMLVFADSEPFHITIKAVESGFDGNELAQLLRENGVECEYSDTALVILLMSPFSRQDDYRRLSSALEKALCSAVKSPEKAQRINMTLPQKAMSVCEAVFSESEETDVENALGRICAEVKVPCPPAVPIAASGEIIDESCINIFKMYGISTVNVVK